jgi:hypothetical protein
MYDQNLRRSEREAVHNRGHQLEQVLEYANFLQDGNSDLFWQKFVGPGDSSQPFRRCGWTHVPPNTTVQYDYHSNYNEVLSDCPDWTPEGIGQKTLVSAHTWGDHPYPWPLGTMPIPQEDRNEAHWYIYWMQSMPGRDNAIPFGRNRMTNWWRFTGDWDASIRGRLGLYERATPTCAADISNGAAAAAVTRLTRRVEALVSPGGLSRAEAHALGVKLDAAARRLDRDRPRPAVNLLQAFVNQVEALLRSHRLAADDGQSLSGPARCLISRLEPQGASLSLSRRRPARSPLRRRPRPVPPPPCVRRRSAP